MSVASPTVEFHFERLRERPRARARSAWWPFRKERVLRRFCVDVAAGQTRLIRHADRSIRLRCASGSLWITQDGDCKDVVLDAQQVWQPEREAPLLVHALQGGVLEIEFEDTAAA